MANPRFALSFLILTGVIAGAVVACGDDDDAGDLTGGTDAGKADTGSAGDAASGDAAISDAGATQLVAGPTVYLGAAVKLDGSTSVAAGGTYAWTVTSAPPGSAVVTASLVDATTATPGFVPDRPGSYVVSLAVSGSAVPSFAFTVTVVDPPVFYAHADDDGGGVYTASLNVVGAGFGDGGSPVSCFARDAGGGYVATASQIGKMDSDWWEAPAGQASKLVYAMETREDGGSHVSLLASTSSSTCASAPVTLDELDFANRAFEEPSLSPSGTRVAYLRTASGGTTVSTVGFDGSGRRDLAPYYALADGSGSPTTVTNGDSYVTRPAWLDAATVAWAQQTTGSGWQIVSSADAAGSAPKVVMTCTGSQPRQIALLKSGEMLVTESPPGQAPPIPGFPPTASSNTRITAYTINPVTKACTSPRDVSKIDNTSSSVSAQDFALSPDKSMVAFVTVPTANAAYEIRVVKVDGTLVSSTRTATNVGPRWVGGGAFLAWSGTEATFDDASTSPNSTVLAVTQADGGGLHQVTTPPTGNAAVYAIGNGFCAMGRGYGSGVTFFGVLGVAGLRLARRRKRGAKA